MKTKRKHWLYRERDRHREEVESAEKRKTAYMKEANGMRVERQVVLLRVQSICEEAKRIAVIDRRKKKIIKQELRDLDWNCKALIGMLRKDPERL